MQALGLNITLSNGTQGSNTALVNNNYHNIAPRVGLSWDIRGNGKTALRLGAGQFYQRELVGLDEGMEKGTPFSLTDVENRTIDSNVAVGGTGAPALSPNYAKATRAVTPNSWQWNVTVEQELAKNTTLEVGYVGNTGIHLTSMYSFNPVPQADWLADALSGGGTGTNAWRPASNFGGIEGFERTGHATYHSLQTLFKSQVGASTFQASYTWSHSIGDVEMDNSSGTANQEAQTVDNVSSLDKGNTNINRPNIFVANEVYYLPKLANKNAFVRETVGGWQLNSIFTASHGSSLTVFTNAGLSNTVVTGECLPGQTCGGATNNGTTALPVTSTNTISNLIGTGYVGNNRPLTTGTGCNSGEKENQILNGGAFTLVGYNLGTVMPNMERRGYCYGAPTTDWDAQIAKNWEIKEKFRIKFSMDFFDLLNHPNFNTSGLEGTAWNPSNIQCGQNITVDTFTTTAPCSTTNSTVTSNSAPGGFGSVQALQSGKGFREVQYGLKFSF